MAQYDDSFLFEEDDQPESGPYYKSTEYVNKYDDSFLFEEPKLEPGPVERPEYGRELPEMRPYEPTLWDRVQDFFPSNRARASNERVARQIAEEQKVPIDEVYRSAGGARPMLNPEGRPAIRSAAEGAGIVAKQLPDLPAGVANTVLRTIRGGDTTLDDEGWIDRMIDATDIEEDPDADPNYESFQNLGKNLGYSLTTMVSGALAFMGGSALTTPAGGSIAATAASGAVAYRGSKDEFLDRVRDYMDEQYEELYGRKMSQEDWDQVYKDYEWLAAKYGAWEAIPEAVGNLVFIKAFAKPLSGLSATRLQIFKEKANQIAGRTAQVLTTENTTEVITALGQNRAELEAGLTKEKLDIPGAIREVAVPTTLLTTLMGAAGGVAKYGADYMGGRKPAFDQPVEFKATHKAAGGVDVQQATRNGQPEADFYVDAEGNVYRDPAAVKRPDITPSSFVGPLDANTQMDKIKAEIFGDRAGPDVNQGIINSIFTPEQVRRPGEAFQGPQMPPTPQQVARSNQDIINREFAAETASEAAQATQPEIVTDDARPGRPVQQPEREVPQRDDLAARRQQEMEKAKAKPEPVTTIPAGFEQFIKLARKTKDANKFIKEAQKIRDVPKETAQWFRDKYDPEKRWGRDLPLPKAVEKFIKDVRDGVYKNAKPKQELKKYDVYLVAMKTGQKWAVHETDRADGFGDAIFDTEAEANTYADEIKTRDTANKEFAEKQEKAAHEKATKEQEFIDSYNGFLGENKLKAGRIRKILERSILYKGKPISRKALVEKLIQEGRRVNTTKTGERIFGTEDAFLNEEDITKTGMDYAEYLEPDQLEAKQEVPRGTPAEPAEVEVAPAEAPETYKNFNGRKITYQVEVEETGEVYDMTEDAGDAMRETDARLDALKQLRDCIAR